MRRRHCIWAFSLLIFAIPFPDLTITCYLRMCSIEIQTQIHQSFCRRLVPLTEGVVTSLCWSTRRDMCSACYMQNILLFATKVPRILDHDWPSTGIGSHIPDGRRCALVLFSGFCVLLCLAMTSAMSRWWLVFIRKLNLKANHSVSWDRRKEVGQQGQKYHPHCPTVLKGCSMRK